jgi:predicted Zn-dependent peptidase
MPRVPEPERWTMGNGLRVLAVPRRTLPQVALRLILPAGAAAEPRAAAGLANLTGALLSEGTAELDATELNRRLDLLGAALHVNVGHDFAEVDLALLSETLAEGVRLFADLILRPSFPEAELERVRAETLDALDARADEPSNVADDRAGAELFGPDHPYGRLTVGTPSGVASVSRGLVAEFHAARYRPDGAILLAAGDFDTPELRGRLDDAFGDWGGRAEPAHPPVVEPPAGARTIHVPWPDASQAEIRVVGRGMSRADPDWVPAAVANYLLGGSTITGRLGANLREEKGWTYGVRSGFAAAVRPGGWAIETAVGAPVTAAAVREIEGELRRFAAEPVGDEELQRARDALVLSLPRAFETPGRIATRLGTVEAFGLPEDYWQRFAERVLAVTVEDVQRIARRYFDPDSLLRVVVGPDPEGNSHVR